MIFKFLQQNKKLVDKEVRQILKERLKSAKKRALEKNLEFDIDLKYLLELYYQQKGRCCHTGKLLSLLPNHHNTISLDRLNSDSGYVKGNVGFTYSYLNEKKGRELMESYIGKSKDIISDYDDFQNDE